MTELVIGCPVYKRDWIIRHWYEHAATAAGEAGYNDPMFVVVGDEIADRETYEVLRAAMTHDLVMVTEFEDGSHNGSRVWNPLRYERMTHLRNRMLQVVRDIDPRFFLSLDSDILLHPKALSAMIENTDRWDAVGSRVYMDRSRSFPSYAFIPRHGGLRRNDSDGVFTVDVIMAVKLMNRLAYHVDYVTDWHGEDIGWSKAARAAGLKVGWDGRFCSKHVMRPEDLNKVDERAGF